jgi:hypothetical protein
MFGSNMSTTELNALNTIAKHRAKKGKGTYYKGDDYESMDPSTGKMSHNVITYQGNTPGSKKVYLDSGKYYFGKKRRNL